MVQTKLIDDRWYTEPGTLEEAISLIHSMLRALEQAEKKLNKPDYELVKRLDELKPGDMATVAALEQIKAEIKSVSIARKPSSRRGLWILPYKDGKPNHRESRRITRDLSKHAEAEEALQLGTRLVTKQFWRTKLPPGLADEHQNFEWLFKPSKLELKKIE